MGEIVITLCTGQGLEVESTKTKKCKILTLTFQCTFAVMEAMGTKGLKPVVMR